MQPHGCTLIQRRYKCNPSVARASLRAAIERLAMHPPTLLPRPTLSLARCTAALIRDAAPLTDPRIMP